MRNILLQRFACICFAIILMAAGGRGKTPEGDSVAVEYAYPILTIHVRQATKLSTVLETICQRTGSRCEIGLSAVEVVLAPMVAVGTWAEVIAELLEGARLNYATVAPELDRPGRLVVAARSAADKASPEPLGRAARGMPAGLADNAATASTEMPPREEDSSSASKRFRNTPSLESSPRAPAAGTRNPPVYEATPSSSLSPPPGMTMLPFPGENGNPVFVPITNQAPASAVLPFPDPSGNPIVIPVTDQPLIGSPFPGPDDRPIPVAPTVPSPSALNPLPPS